MRSQITGLIMYLELNFTNVEIHFMFLIRVKFDICEAHFRATIMNGLCKPNLKRVYKNGPSLKFTTYFSHFTLIKDITYGVRIMESCILSLFL